MQVFDSSWYGKSDHSSLVTYLRGLADTIERCGLEGVTVELSHVQEPNEGGMGELPPYTHTASGATWLHLRANPDAWIPLDDQEVTDKPDWIGDREHYNRSIGK